VSGRRYAPEQLERARGRYALSKLVARRVKLKFHGGEATGMCPFHKERTPSFTVIDGKGFYHCFGCGAHGDAIAWLVEGEGMGFLDAVAWLLGEAPASRPAPASPSPAPERDRAAEERRRAFVQQTARELWRASAPIAGTPGEAYFRRRGITLPLPLTLRWNPRVIHPSSNLKARPQVVVELPAVIAAIAAPDRRIVAVHRIFLDPASLRDRRPHKTRLQPDKALLGAVSAGAVRLAPAAEELGTAEGIETALAVMQATWRADGSGLGIWAGIDAEHMSKVEFPPEVRRLVVLADLDPICRTPGRFFGRRPGGEMARRTAARFVASAPGRSARIATPDGEELGVVKADYNDLLVA
jgi:DNA primase